MYNLLTPEEDSIINRKATETPFSGEYDGFYKEGVYICKKCNNPLFNSEAKFRSGCGWPSFEGHFPNAVKQIPDEDGFRTEIQCANCGAHLGHVFMGEKFTEKDTRHCVNSLSIRFVPAGQTLPEVIREA